MEPAVSPPPVVDHSATIKRLANSLRILVYVQAAALCGVFVLWILFDVILPYNPGWDPAVYLLCRLLAWVGRITFVIAAFWGIGKVARIARPILIRLYVWGFFLWFLLLFLLLFFPVLALQNETFGLLVLESIYAIISIFYILCFILPFYSVIPQFFIARWLAKKGKDDAMQLGEFLRPPLLRQPCYLIVAVPAFMIALLWGWMEILNQVIMPPSPLVISEEITRVTSPLTDDGYIDFFKALEARFYPPELATDDNGYCDFVRLFGDVVKRKEEDREFYRLQLYEKLGLDPDVPPTLVLPDFPHEVLRELDEDRLWTLEDYPMLADWITEVDAPLDAIAEALRKSVFFPPLLQSPRETQSRVPNWLLSSTIVRSNNIHMTSRSIVQNFSSRAGYRIAHGDIDGAIDDKLSILRLGRLVSRQGGVVERSIGAAFERTALSIPVGANPEHPLTEQQIRRILDGLDALSPRIPITESIEWERYSALSAIQYVMIGVGASRVSSAEQLGQDVPPMLFTRTFDWNVVFRRTNELFDAMQEPPPRTKLASIVDGIDVPDGTGSLIFRLYCSFLIPGTRDTFMANAFTGILGSIPVNQMEERMLQTECSVNMQRLALSILLYQHEHGIMPDENWAMQIEKYLGENLEQYFSCPLNPAPEEHTTYAMVQYGDELPTNPDTLLLVELTESVPLSEAVVSVDEVLARQRAGSLHSDGMNVALRSGAVRFLPSDTEEAKLLRQLGRE